MKQIKKKTSSSIVSYLNLRKDVTLKITYIMEWNLFKLALYLCVEKLLSEIEFNTVNLNPRNVNRINFICKRFTAK